MKIKKFVSSIILVSMFHSGFAFADPPVPTASPTVLPSPPGPSPGDPTVPTISPMLRGQKAPFSGILLNPPAVATIKVNLDTAKEKCDIEVQKQTATCQAQCDLKLAVSQAALDKEKTVSAVLLKSRDATITDITKKLEESEKNKPSPMLWAGLGVAGGVVITLATVFVVAQATK